MDLSPAERVVQVGTFLYDGEVICDLRIVLRDIRYGTGDYEDPSEVSEDAIQETFYIQYGSTTTRGVFTAGGDGFPSLAAAVKHVEATPGFGSTVRWAEPDPTSDGGTTGS